MSPPLSLIGLSSDKYDFPMFAFYTNLDITRPAEIAPQQNPNSSFSSGSGHSLTSFRLLGNADLSSSPQSSLTGVSDDMAEIHDAFASMKVRMCTYSVLM